MKNNERLLMSNDKNTDKNEKNEITKEGIMKKLNKLRK